MPSMETSVNTEVAMGSGSHDNPGQPAEFSGAWADMAKDMAALSKETGIPVTEPAQPVQGQPLQAVATPVAETKPIATAPQTSPTSAPVVPVAAPATPVDDVPEKFRGPDGKLDVEKMKASYFEAEKALKRAQNSAQQPLSAQPPQAPVVAAPVVANLTPLELKVAQDIWQNGKAGFTEAQAIAIARTQVALTDAKHKADVSATHERLSQFEAHQEQVRQAAELDNLMKNPETNWVMTPKGQEEIMRVRQEKPWINNSPTPIADAAAYLLGQGRIAGKSAGLVNTPIPTASQQGLAPLPVTAAQPISTPAPIKLDTPEQIEAYVKTLNPQQEGEFWKKMGMKWESTNRQFMGL